MVHQQVVIRSCTKSLEMSTVHPQAVGELSTGCPPVLDAARAVRDGKRAWLDLGKNSKIVFAERLPSFNRSWTRSAGSGLPLFLGSSKRPHCALRKRPGTASSNQWGFERSAGRCCRCRSLGGRREAFRNVVDGRLRIAALGVRSPRIRHPQAFPQLCTKRASSRRCAVATPRCTNAECRQRGSQKSRVRANSNRDC